ncbi:MAG: DedA family protein [Bacteroidota bacterium]
MSELFVGFFDWLIALPPALIYAMLLVIAYGENVLPPIPGDMVVVFGGYLAGQGVLNLPAVVVLSTVGGALGFMTMFALGARAGETVRDPSQLRWFPKQGLLKASTSLQAWGIAVVYVNRFLSGLRSVISLAAGMAKMKSGPVWIASTVSSLVWCALIAYAGYAVGDNWEVIGEWLRAYGKVMIGLMGIAFVGVLVIRWRKRNRRPAEASEPAASVSGPSKDA